MRVMNFAAFFFALASAFLLYSLNYETRRVEARVQDKEQAASRARSDIAVLKAEKSHLSRPDRIDSHARAQGLAPPRTDQMGRAARLATIDRPEPGSGSGSDQRQGSRQGAKRLTKPDTRNITGSLTSTVPVAGTGLMTSPGTGAAKPSLHEGQ
ncbi:MAG: hypothetical protein ABL907_10630 [Hyphomicrobium sp.]